MTRPIDQIETGPQQAPASASPARGAAPSTSERTSGGTTSAAGLVRVTRIASSVLGSPVQLVSVTPRMSVVLASTPRDTPEVPLRVARQLATAEGTTEVSALDGTVWFGAPVPSWRRRMRAALCTPATADGGRTRALLTDLAALASDVLRLQSASEDVGAMRQLLGAASHDLRNPLSVLRAGLETLAVHGDELAPSQTERIATLAVRQAKRMSTMVDGLLAVHGLDDGEQFEDVDLRPLVSDVLEGGRLVHQLVELSLVGELPARPVVVRGTPDALARLVTNLVTNAAVHGGGHVWIELRANGDDAVIRIEDDGPGLPDDTPLDGGERDHKAGGHGLGLVIAHRIVTNHHGLIAHEDRDGGGTIIEVRLPLADADD